MHRRRNPDAAESPAAADRETMRREVLAGLSASPRTLPTKYLYDERGSALFDRICELPEYYPTRTETAIMAAHVREMALEIGRRALVIEPGSGSSDKTQLLLRTLDEPAACVPIDISAEHLHAAADRLRAIFPALDVLPIAADFTRVEPAMIPPVPCNRRVVYFPGSTVGNFTLEARASLLQRMASICGDDGRLLIGVDLRKDRATVEAAYNDAQGVTAAFNRNILAHINRELDADFDPAAFDHRAFYNDAADRIESHLVATRAQTATVAGRRFDFAAGESICTEHSHKFTIDGFTAEARAAGFRPVRHWTDERQRFAVVLLAR